MTFQVAASLGLRTCYDYATRSQKSLGGEERRQAGRNPPQPPRPGGNRQACGEPRARPEHAGEYFAPVEDVFVPLLSHMLGGVLKVREHTLAAKPGRWRRVDLSAVLDWERATPLGRKLLSALGHGEAGECGLLVEVKTPGVPVTPETLSSMLDKHLAVSKTTEGMPVASVLVDMNAKTPPEIREAAEAGRPTPYGSLQVGARKTEEGFYVLEVRRGGEAATMLYVNTREAGAEGAFAPPRNAQAP